MKLVITRARSGRGFTLIELLAVIAILAVLASLLLPGLANVQMKAKGAKFQSNLRQVAAALQMWADEHNNRYPHFLPLDPNTGLGVAAKMWQNELMPYLGLTTAEDKIRMYHDPVDNSKWQGTYKTCNTAMNGYGSEANWANNPGHIATANAFGRPLSSINQPSKLFLVGPGGASSASTEWGNGARMNGYEMFISGPAHFLRYDNGGGSYYVMADGHAEYKTTAWLWNETINRNTSLFFSDGGAN